MLVLNEAYNQFVNGVGIE